MTKPIKLNDETYRQLERFRGKRETFSQAVDRLLVIKDGVSTMADILEGNEDVMNFQDRVARRFLHPQNGRPAERGE